MSDEPSGKPVPRIDPLQLGFGNVVAKEEPGAKSTRMIAAREQIDVPNMIRLENNDCGWRTRVEALPHLCRVGRRSERIKNQHLAPRFDTCTRYYWVPALARLPVGVFESPYPQARRDIANFHWPLALALPIVSEDGPHILRRHASLLKALLGGPPKASSGIAAVSRIPAAERPDLGPPDRL